jgi:TonB-like protein
MNYRRSYWLFAVLFVTLAAAAAVGQTKTTATTEWDTFSPENEEFSILMPKDVATDVSKVPYHQFELSLRLYLSAPASGPVLGVASVSGIKANLGSDFARFNSYVDAFKTFFPSRVRKDAVGKLILVSSRPFHGYASRSYKLTVGDLTGSVSAVLTRKRFYAVVLLNTKKDEALEEKFLSSFTVPDKPVEQVATAEGSQDPNAANANNTPQASREGRRPPAEGEAASSGTTQGETPKEGVDQPANNTDPNAPPAANGQKAPRAPISGGMLNGKAIYLPVPEVPAGQPTGVVLVQVLIDEQGSVIDAKAVSGPAPLHAAAVGAARLARFMPTILAGEPVKVSGTLSYNFARSN